MTFDARERSQYGGQPVLCFRFRHADDTWRWTTADRSVALPVGTFEPAPIACSDFKRGVDAGLQEVTVRRDNPLAALLIGHTPVEPIGLVIYGVHRGESEVIVAWKGEVVSHRADGARVILSCAPVLHRLRRKVPGFTFQGQCNHALYRTGCDVTPASFRVSGVVSTITGAVIEVGVAAAQVDGWYNNGYVERADGSRRFIIAHVGASLTLHWPFQDLAVSESVDLFAGCQRDEATCAAKFANLVNHLGFARIPTRNPYDQSIT